MSRPAALFLILGLCLLAGAARVWNVRDIFIDERIYFVDADCYSRMTRAQLVASGQGLVLRHHDFENWPHGTTPHTTALMDWMIVSIARILDAAFACLPWIGRSILRGQTLDCSGAIISPLLGIATCGFLGLWGWSLKLPGWFAPAFFAAVSPILVHGTVLGRPDHQSLLVLFLAMALGAELALARCLSRGWGIIAGLAWALALWVSLYEPAVLFGLVLTFWIVADLSRFSGRNMRPGWIVFAVVLTSAILVDARPLLWPDAAFRAVFTRWEETIGELAHVGFRSPLLYRWVGAGVLLVPAVLAICLVPAWRSRLSRARGAFAPALALLLFAATLALTLWQVRWGYFLGVVFALSLPSVFEALRRPWIAWPLFLLSLWPLAQDWDEKLFAEDHPELEGEQKRGLLRLESVRLREIAERMRSPRRQAFLAPWWLSPALAYWSGQPGVAGSSHQSLPGIVASAHFFLAPDAAEAERIVRELGVSWIITDDPERLVSTSRLLLDAPDSATPPFVAHLHAVAEPRERATPADLRAASPAAQQSLLKFADEAETEQLGTAAFSCVASDQFYKLFWVKEATLPP